MRGQKRGFLAKTLAKSRIPSENHALPSFYYKTTANIFDFYDKYAILLHSSVESRRSKMSDNRVARQNTLPFKAPKTDILYIGQSCKGDSGFSLGLDRADRQNVGQSRRNFPGKNRVNAMIWNRH